jgi:hypothetical protein
MIVGSDDEKIFNRPFFSPVDIWMQVQHYFNDNDIFVNLKPFSFNVPQKFGSPSKKISMIEDMEEYLKDSVYNFIYRLLCTGTNPISQFSDIKQALDHKFIKILSPDQQLAHQALSEAWNTFPADY